MQRRPRLWATVDRIELDRQGRGRAVLVFDDGQQLVLPVEQLPAGARPGQVLTVRMEVDAQETARRASQIERLQRELFGE